MRDTKNTIFIGIRSLILLTIIAILFFILNQNNQLKSLAKEIKQTNNTIHHLSVLYQKALRHSLTNRAFSLSASQKIRDSIQITATILLQQLHIAKESFSNRTDVKKDLDSLTQYV